MKVVKNVHPKISILQICTSLEIFNINILYTYIHNLELYITNIKL